jgi:methylated-DNA-[protein]-cysteine S-methyltransferase
MDPAAPFYALLSSDFGTLGVVWREAASGPIVQRVLLPRTGTAARDLIRRAFSGGVPQTAQPIAGLVGRIGLLLKGEAVDFDLEILDLGQCSDFQRRVLLAEHRIPRGWVSSYGGIAKHLGVPGGARAVGQALARNPFPIVIPCHRAIRSDGRLGGFQGGLEMKRALLELEGVEVSPAGIVSAQRFYD